MSLSQNYPTTRPTLTLDFAKAKRVDPRVTFTRATTATYFDASGTLRSAAANAPRIDFDPATLLCRGLLVEEQRANLALNSENFNSWSKTNSTISVDVAAAPSGNTTADKHVPDNGASMGTGASSTRVHQTVSLTAGAMSFSIFAKAAEFNAIELAVIDSGGSHSGSVNLLTGETITSSLATITTSSVGNNWWRIFFTFTMSVTESNQIRVSAKDTVATTGDGTSGVYIWGAQLEAGAFPTSYIPTTTTSLTRSADEASVTTLSPWYNTSQSTLFMEFVWEGLKSVAGQRIAIIDDGSTSNYLGALATSLNSMQGAVVVSGTTEAVNSTPATTYAANTPYKQALALELNNSASAVNGTAGVVDTSVSVPSGLTTLRLAASSSTVTSNIWFRRIAYYNTRLPNEQLQALTAP